MSQLFAMSQLLNRGWDGWMASLTWWMWIWVNSGSWWWTGRPGMLHFMGSQRVGHDWVTELNWTMMKSIVLMKVCFRPWCWERLKAGGEGDDRVKWLDGITNSMDMGLGLVMDWEPWRAALHGVTKSQIRLSDWTELNWIFPCINVPHPLYPFLCRWTFRVLPCLGYCKHWHDEHWGAWILLDHVFLWMYAQDWDCRVIWKFYF